MRSKDGKKIKRKGTNLSSGFFGFTRSSQAEREREIETDGQREKGIN